MQRRDLLVLVGGSATVAVSGCLGDDGDEEGDDGSEETDDTPDETDDTTDDGDENGVDEEPAFFEVGNLDPADTTTDLGDLLQVTVDVTNTGDESGTKDIELRVDDETIATEALELAGGDSETVSFEVETAELEPGEYTHSVWTDDDEAAGTLTLEEVVPATFEVDNLDPEETTAPVGENLPIAADITNTGDEAGEKAVELRLDGETTLTQDLELAAGESETVEMQIDTTDIEVGEYEHSIWTEDGEAVGMLSLVEEIGELELTVLDTADERVEGAVVGGDGIDAQTDADGFVQMELEPGSYDLTVTFRGVEETITVEITAGEVTEATVEFDAEEIALEITGFVAENTGGYISFDEETQEEAEAEGVEFPAGDVVLEGTVEDGWWESTDVSFATLDAGLAEADVEAPSGLEGTFDYENGVVTAEGELEVTTAGETFRFEIAATTEDSGDLSGSSAFEETGGPATLVDNEYTVEDETGALVDSILGLPVEEPGLCWLELPMEFEFEQ